MTPGTCVLCDRALTGQLRTAAHADARLYTCDTCGEYWATGILIATGAFSSDDIKSRRYLLSAMTKAAPEPLMLDRKQRDELRTGFPRERTVAEKMELMIRWFAGKSSELGHEVRTNYGQDYPVAWCKSADEWLTLLTHLATDARSLWLAGSPGLSDSLVRVTMKGWQWLDEKPKASGTKAFIAMAFHPILNPTKDAIETAIRDAGYEPLRVDDDHYVGGVMDRIITNIRESRFIVADFTKNRGGVYYEAGVAFGLGIPIVHVCDAECLDDKSDEKLHFDVRHLNFIPWRVDKLPLLTRQLTDRIVAVFGRGPSSG